MRRQSGANRGEGNGGAALRQPAALAVAAAATLLHGSGAVAQSEESQLTPESAAQVRDAEHYAMPDVPDATLASANIDPPEKNWGVNWGAAILPADYTTFTQDRASKEQVGIQDDTYQVRSFRLSSYGYFELLRRWSYLLSYEYKGFAQIPGTANWQPTDIRLSTKFQFATLTFGKFKEPFVYEMVGDSANLPQSERLLNPFFKSRNLGVQLSNTFLNERATWAVGAYNNWLTTSSRISEAGKDFAARVTGLPLWADEGASYLHVAMSLRYVGADSGVLRFKGTPASNVASNYVDTGNMAGNHAWNTGFEALWNSGPYSLLGEYVSSSVRSASSADPHFSGGYVTASWVITGEHRPYDRKAAYARRVLPSGRWGAWELMARYGRVSLEDAEVHGGTMHGGWAGVNWWATRRWKFSVSAGEVTLERFGLSGNTLEVLSRIQWIY
jgi:phosphate-selective porin